MGHANAAVGAVVNQRKVIDPYHLAERQAIKLEPIRNPTPRQVHEAREECLREFRELYVDFEIVQWPREKESP
jgi:hypothetical protein